MSGDFNTELDYSEFFADLELKIILVLLQNLKGMMNQAQKLNPYLVWVMKTVALL